MILGLGAMTDAQVADQQSRWAIMNQNRVKNGLPPLPVPSDAAIREMSQTGGGFVMSQDESGGRTVGGHGGFEDLVDMFQDPLSATLSSEVRAGRAEARREAAEIDSQGVIVNGGNGANGNGKNGFPWLWVGGGLGLLGLGWFMFGRKRRA